MFKDERKCEICGVEENNCITDDGKKVCSECLDKTLGYNEFTDALIDFMCD